MWGLSVSISHNRVSVIARVSKLMKAQASGKRILKPLKRHRLKGFSIEGRPHPIALKDNF